MKYQTISLYRTEKNTQLSKVVNTWTFDRLTPNGNEGVGVKIDYLEHAYDILPKFEGKGEQPFLHLMEFEDYLVASGVRVEPEEVRGNTV